MSNTKEPGGTIVDLSKFGIWYVEETAYHAYFGLIQQANGTIVSVVTMQETEEEARSTMKNNGLVMFFAPIGQMLGDLIVHPKERTQ